MAKIELIRPIAAPLEQVFVFFVPQRMPYWYGAEMQSCFELQNGAANFSTGLKVRITGTLGVTSVSHTAVVTAYEYGRLLEWRFHDEYGVRGKERWELTRAPAPGVQTVVRFLNEYEMPGRVGRITDWLITRHSVAQRNRGYLARLARLVERP
jgi:hypothetical protein